MSLARSRRLPLAAVVTVALLGAVGWQVLPMLRAEAEDGIGRGDDRRVTASGAAVAEATLDGAPSAVFFGFTHCQEVCPTTLGDISAWQAALAGEGAHLRVFFVPVDPERDTAEVLGDDMSWAGGVTAVTGARPEIDKALKAFKVYAAKIPLEDGGCTMDHAALVMRFDADGRYADLLRHQEPEAMVLPKRRRLLDG